MGVRAGACPPVSPSSRRRPPRARRRPPSRSRTTSWRACARSDISRGRHAPAATPRLPRPAGPERRRRRSLPGSVRIRRAELRRRASRRRGCWRSPSRRPAASARIRGCAGPHRARPRPPERALLALIPPQARAGEIFQRQPDGRAGLAVLGTGFTPGDVIPFGGPGSSDDGRQQPRCSRRRFRRSSSRGRATSRSRSRIRGPEPARRSAPRSISSRPAILRAATAGTISATVAGGVRARAIISAADPASGRPRDRRGDRRLPGGTASIRPPSASGDRAAERRGRDAARRVAVSGRFDVVGPSAGARVRVWKASWTSVLAGPTAGVSRSALASGPGRPRILRDTVVLRGDPAVGTGGGSPAGARRARAARDHRAGSRRRSPPSTRSSSPSRGSPRRAGARPRTIVLFLVDTLRADHVSAYGYAKPTTPRPRPRTFADGCGRRPACRPPTGRCRRTRRFLPSHSVARHGVGRYRPVSARRRSRRSPGRSRAPGTARSPSPAAGYVDPSFGFARGFDRYDVVPGAGPEAVARALAMLDEHSRRAGVPLPAHVPGARLSPPDESVARATLPRSRGARARTGRRDVGELRETRDGGPAFPGLDPRSVRRRAAAAWTRPSGACSRGSIGRGRLARHRDPLHVGPRRGALRSRPSRRSASSGATGARTSTRKSCACRSRCAIPWRPEARGALRENALAARRRADAGRRGGAPRFRVSFEGRSLLAGEPRRGAGSIVTEAPPLDAARAAASGAREDHPADGRVAGSPVRSDDALLPPAPAEECFDLARDPAERQSRRRARRRWGRRCARAADRYVASRLSGLSRPARPGAGPRRSFRAPRSRAGARTRRRAGRCGRSASRASPPALEQRGFSTEVRFSLGRRSRLDRVRAAGRLARPRDRAWTADALVCDASGTAVRRGSRSLVASSRWAAGHALPPGADGSSRRLRRRAPPPNARIVCRTTSCPGCSRSAICRGAPEPHSRSRAGASVPGAGGPPPDLSVGRSSDPPCALSGAAARLLLASAACREQPLPSVGAGASRAGARGRGAVAARARAGRVSAAGEVFQRQPDGNAALAVVGTGFSPSRRDRLGGQPLDDHLRAQPPPDGRRCLRSCWRPPRHRSRSRSRALPTPARAAVGDVSDPAAAPDRAYRRRSIAGDARRRPAGRDVESAGRECAVTVVGAGLAGSECAWQLARRGHRVGLCRDAPAGVDRRAPDGPMRRARLLELLPLRQPRQRRRAPEARDGSARLARDPVRSARPPCRRATPSRWTATSSPACVTEALAGVRRDRARARGGARDSAGDGYVVIATGPLTSPALDARSGSCSGPRTSTSTTRSRRS